jgi:hypothetical protein
MKMMKITLILLLALSRTAGAQGLATSFAKLSASNIIFADPDGVKLPGDGRPWVIVIFKSCCAMNQRAVHWVLQIEKVFGDSVGVLGINSDYARALSKVRPWLSANKVDFTVFQDPSHEVINTLSIIAVPTVFILNQKGEEDFESAGFFGGSGKEMEEHLRKLITQSSSAPVGGDEK